MSNPASARLQQNAKRIMSLWEERARNEVAASMRQDSLVLQDSLPQYLGYLGDELSTKIDRTPARVNADKVNSDRERQQTLAAGFQTHMAKPIEPTQLILMVANLVGQVRND